MFPQWCETWQNGIKSCNRMLDMNDRIHSLAFKNKIYDLCMRFFELQDPNQFTTGSIADDHQALFERISSLTGKSPAILEHGISQANWAIPVLQKICTQPGVLWGTSSSRIAYLRAGPDSWSGESSHRSRSTKRGSLEISPALWTSGDWYKRTSRVW